MLLLAACSQVTSDAPGQLESQAAFSAAVPFPSSLYLNGETVNFTGTVHMVSPQDPYLPPNPIRIHTNLAAVRGVGQTTGGVYRVTGASSHSFSQPPPGSYQFVATYRLLPPNPIRQLPPNPILPSVSLAFDVTLGDGGAISGVQVTQQIVESPF